MHSPKIFPNTHPELRSGEFGKLVRAGKLRFWTWITWSLRVNLVPQGVHLIHLALLGDAFLVFNGGLGPYFRFLAVFVGLHDLRFRFEGGFRS